MENHKVSEIHITEKDIKDVEVERKDLEEKDEEVTPEEEPEAEITYQTRYVNISSLNVRSGPGVDHDAVGIVTINQELEAEDSSGWVKVKTEDISGYVNSKYLSEEEVVLQAVLMIQKMNPKNNLTYTRKMNQPNKSKRTPPLSLKMMRKS
ncbi:SH3 domain-containing protein [Virgibacillus kimchii]